MTEQIERELTALFHDRAQHLDVLPPRPVAQVRRARLQAGLALASVVAVVAGAGLVGARLASGTGPDRSVTATASGQRAQADLDRALRRTLAARAVATSSHVEVPSGKFLDAPDLGYSAASSRNETGVTRYDGAVGDAVTMAYGEPQALLVHDVLYTGPEPRYYGHTVPIRIQWVRHTRPASDSPADWREASIAGTIPGMFGVFEMPGPAAAVTEHDGQFRVTSRDYGHVHIVTLVQLGSSGLIDTMISRFVRTETRPDTDPIERVTFGTLHGSVGAKTPAASQVMTSDAYDQAKQTYDQAGCPTPKPSTGPDGTKRSAAFGCRYSGDDMSSTAPPTSAPLALYTVPVSPVPSSSPR